jgi:hypothetical protein
MGAASLARTYIASTASALVEPSGWKVGERVSGFDSMTAASGRPKRDSARVLHRLKTLSSSRIRIVSEADSKRCGT